LEVRRNLFNYKITIKTTTAPLLGLWVLFSSLYVGLS
jgi:hypothetical protein